MSKRFGEGILPFKVVATNEPSISKDDLVLPYQLSKSTEVNKSYRQGVTQAR